MNKKFMILSITVALLVVATITISSYAYFSIGNKTGNENVITSGTMALTLTDGAEITANNLLPGESIEKEFTVENTGNIETRYDIYLSEVINNFADKTDLVYEITSNDGGYNTENPVQAPSTSNKIISSYVIGVGETHTYTLKITFLNKDEIQDDNQGKVFKAKIQINEYKDINTVVNYYIDNSLVNNMPTNAYVYDHSSCDKGASVSFDSTNWTYETNINQKNTTCNIYFEAPEYTLTYDYNYDGSTPTSTTIKLGQPYGTLPEVNRTNYQFAGWYTEPSGGTEVTAETLMSAADTRIYAHYNGYTITYNSNGGSGSMSNTTSEIVDNVFIAPTSDKMFDKWNTSANGSGTSYNPGDEMNSNLDLYAIWKDKPKPITSYSSPWQYGQYYQLTNGDLFMSTNTNNLLVMIDYIGIGNWSTGTTQAQAYNPDLSSRLMKNAEAVAMGGDAQRANKNYGGPFNVVECEYFSHWLLESNSDHVRYVTRSGGATENYGDMSYNFNATTVKLGIRPVVTIPNTASIASGTGTVSDPYVFSNY